MNKLVKEGLLPNYDKVYLSTCKHCLIGKSTKKSFGKGTKIEYFLQLVHFDICRLINVRVRHRAYYFITFIDNFTCFNFVYLKTHKFEALKYLQIYISLAENQLDRKIEVLQTN